MSDLTAYALNCSLKPSPAPSSCGLLLDQVLAELATHGVKGSMDRVVDHDVKPGVTSDEGGGDAWPDLRAKVLAADIFILGSPIWLGHPSSLAQRVLERMDAFLGETDDRGRMVSYGRVAGVAVVGNEDGAHHVTAQLYQGLADVGFTIPANGVTYWVGRAMQTTDYNDLDETPKETARATAMMARNVAHLARLLKSNGYPGDPDAEFEKDK
ncbi:MAG: NAD(P)H-dependent oxidoreductase [Actinomycetota bacterium]|nr:NAD(P)H-dependent oxidoreductase [Actinomycetota bacterium]